MNNQSIPHAPLRVVFCTHPSIYSTIVFQELVRSPHLELTGVVASTRTFRKKGWAWWDIILLVRRAGLRYAVYLWLVTSLHTLFCRLWRRNSVREYSVLNRIPIIKTRDINDVDGVAFVKACNPDMMLSAYFNQLIGPELLGLPAKGCLNIHPGVLPEYKGVDPVIHALARGENRLGVTVHFQDQGFDTGPVAVSGSLPVQSEDDLFSLNCKLFRLGTGLLLDKITKTGGIPCGKLQDCSDRYDSWPDAGVVNMLRRSGRKLVDIRSYLKVIKRGDI